MTNIELIKAFDKGATEGGSGGRLYGRYNLRIEGDCIVNYSTIIAKRLENGAVILNNYKYSRTTSKIQSYIRQYSNVILELNEDDFKLMLNRDVILHNPQELRLENGVLMQEV